MAVWVHGLRRELLLPIYFLCPHIWHSLNYFIFQLLLGYGGSGSGVEVNDFFVTAEFLAFFLLIKVEIFYLTAW